MINSEVNCKSQPINKSETTAADLVIAVTRVIDGDNSTAPDNRGNSQDYLDHRRHQRLKPPFSKIRKSGRNQTNGSAARQPPSARGS